MAYFLAIIPSIIRSYDKTRKEERNTTVDILILYIAGVGCFLERRARKYSILEN